MINHLQLASVSQVYRALRRAYDMGRSAELTIAQWDAAVEYFAGCCTYCGVMFTADNKATVEHIVSLSQEASPGSIASNIIPACKCCNDRKHGLILQDWLKAEFSEAVAGGIHRRILAYLDQLPRKGDAS